LSELSGVTAFALLRLPRPRASGVNGLAFPA
jgi:hypothetical protein